MMYAPALFFMIILGLAATASVAGIAAAAQSAVSIATNRALETGIRHAVALFESNVASTISTDANFNTDTGQGSIDVLSDTTRLHPATYTETVAPFTLSETVTPTTVTSPNCLSDASGTDVATSVQCSPFVQESRASLRIDVVVYASDGSTEIGRRSAIATLRMLGVPPFSAITGLKDLTAPNPTDSNVDNDASAPQEDDSAGRNGTIVAPDRQYGSASSSGADTTIHVQYQCMQTGSNCDQPRPPVPDQLTTRHWTNGNSTQPTAP